MLQFLWREEADECLVDDCMEAFHECYGLLLDLSVHLEVRHVVDIADPATHTACDTMATEHVNTSSPTPQAFHAIG